MTKKEIPPDLLNSILTGSFGMPRSATSGLIPKGDARLTINISKEHHKKLKVTAAQLGTTVGELIEQMIDEKTK